mmetsp:Transcript_20665/g.48779  ORF Transcript_20665/g.48779 Transcript_20665/m.48779 type:complete len:317 (+) Transcript_20665:190-1140(+)
MFCERPDSFLSLQSLVVKLLVADRLCINSPSRSSFRPCVREKKEEKTSVHPPEAKPNRIEPNRREGRMDGKKKTGGRAKSLSPPPMHTRGRVAVASPRPLACLLLRLLLLLPVVVVRVVVVVLLLILRLLPAAAAVLPSLLIFLVRFSPSPVVLPQHLPEPRAVGNILLLLLRVLPPPEESIGVEGAEGSDELLPEVLLDDGRRRCRRRFRRRVGPTARGSEEPRQLLLVLEGRREERIRLFPRKAEPRRQRRRRIRILRRSFRRRKKPLFFLLVFPHPDDPFLLVLLEDGIHPDGDRRSDPEHVQVLPSVRVRVR